MFNEHTNWISLVPFVTDAAKMSVRVIGDAMFIINDVIAALMLGCRRGLHVRSCRLSWRPPRGSQNNASARRVEFGPLEKKEKENRY